VRLMDTSPSSPSSLLNSPTPSPSSHRVLSEGGVRAPQEARDGPRPRYHSLGGKPDEWIWLPRC
jgi:hypothetical protein